EQCAGSERTRSAGSLDQTSRNRGGHSGGERIALAGAEPGFPACAVGPFQPGVRPGDVAVGRRGSEPHAADHALNTRPDRSYGQRRGDCREGCPHESSVGHLAGICNHLAGTRRPSRGLELTRRYTQCPPRGSVRDWNLYVVGAKPPTFQPSLVIPPAAVGNNVDG